LTACCVEKSGQETFDFEYGRDFRDHIAKVNPDFVKVLCRYNPDGSFQKNRGQLARLKILSDFCHEKKYRFMFELLVPATSDQLTSVESDLLRYDYELRPALMLRAMEEIQNYGIEPNIWKIEGVHKRIDCEKLSQQARVDGRDEVGLIVLGRGKDEKALKEWLTLASQVSGFCGFAIGRTVWESALLQLKNNEISIQTAANLIAKKYKGFCDLWIRSQAFQGSRNVAPS